MPNSEWKFFKNLNLKTIKKRSTKTILQLKKLKIKLFCIEIGKILQGKIRKISCSNIKIPEIIPKTQENQSISSKKHGKHNIFIFFICIQILMQKAVAKSMQSWMLFSSILSNIFLCLKNPPHLILLFTTLLQLRNIDCHNNIYQNCQSSHIWW